MEHVMIVDDNEQNCELVRDLIETWGYHVHKAFQGRDAVELARKIQPDIILLDVMLPGMNGFEVCHELKNNPQTMHIPIVMLTVLTDVDDRIHGLKVGADNFLTKPVNYNELRHVIASVVNRKKQLDRTESHKDIVASYLTMCKLYDGQLFEHLNAGRMYCEKLVTYINLNDQQAERLLLAADLHDIGYIAAGGKDGHAKAGAHIMAGYKMGKWLGPLIEFHDQSLDSQEINWESVDAQNIRAELEALITVNMFVHRSQGDKTVALEEMRKEAQQGKYSAGVVDALWQIVKDDTFWEELKR